MNLIPHQHFINSLSELHNPGAKEECYLPLRTLLYSLKINVTSSTTFVSCYNKHHRAVMETKTE